MANPFDQFDVAPAKGANPFDQFDEEDSSWLDKGVGVLETAAGMFAPMPATILGGFLGAGTAVTQGVDAGVKKLEDIQKWNFGAGEYKPGSKKGQEYSENVGSALQYPVDKAGQFGEFIGGNEGRYVGELLMGSAMEMVEPSMIYGGARAAMRPRKGTGKVGDIRAQQEAVNESKAPPEAPKGPVGEQGNLFDQFDERSPISPYQTEMASDMWRVDENGIPIRADLSMELQNLQQPLQRNLFGDELDVNFPRDPNKPLDMATGDIPGYERMSEPVRFRNDPENQRPLTEAIDSMDPAARTAALEQTGIGREMQADAGLNVAKMELDGPRIPNNRQRGVVDPKVFLGDFPDFIASTIKDAVGDLKVLFRGIKEDYTNADRPMLGTLGEGIYLTESKTLANRYASGGTTGRQIRPYYANVKKPYVMEIQSPEHQDLLLSGREERKAFSDRVKAEGFDGVIIKNGDELKEVMVFSPDQAKNAFTTPSKQGFNARTRKQGGGVLIDPKATRTIDNSQVNAENTIPPNPKVDGVLAKARTEKDGKQWTYVQSGGTSTAMKSGSTAIQAASRIVQNALKAADLAIRNTIFPAEGALRRLSRAEIGDLGTLMKDEMFSGKRYDGDVLAKNLSVKQLEAYTAMRDLFDKTLDAQNEARLAKGQDLITPKEAYLSSRWEGDFRRPVYDADGKLVWYLAANSKLGLEAQSKALKKQFPDLLIDPKKDHTVSSSRSKTDLQGMYTTMLDLLGRDDPAIAKIQKAIEEQVVVQGEDALAQEKHFQQKGNVRGFVGDRPGKDGRGGSSESIAMFQQQIQYAKNAFKWAEMQKAAEDIKGIVSDPVLQDTQPNNVKYIREYFKNAIGMGESQIARALSDSIRSGLGLSPKVIDDAVGGMKSFFILQKLAASPGYILSNMIQAGNVMPYLINLREQGYKGNMGVAMLVGFPAGMMMGTAHILKSVGGEYIDRLPNQFFKDAFQYAEDNGVTARSVYDEAPLETGFGLGTKAVSMAARTMTLPETFVRSTAFMTYAQMLKDSGKFTDQSALFQKAEELVNKSMVDYRETERPLMFAKGGSAGNFANTLQTYPMSFYNQWAYMLKEATRGRPAGLVALAAFQYAVAGAMGIPGFQDAEDIYKWIRDELVSTSNYNKMAKSPFLSDPKLWMMEHLGDASVYGVLSDKSGIGMTSRVAAPSSIDMSQSPLGPITDIAKQAKAFGSAVMDPTNSGKWAQSAMLSVPVGLAGLLEQSSIMEGYTYNVNPKTGEKTFMKNSDLADRSGSYTRTPEEEKLRNWGVRSQKEVVTREVGYATRLANQTLTKKSGELGSKIYNAARQGDVKQVEKLTQLYFDITGKKELPPNFFDRELKEEFYTDIQKNLSKANTPRELLNTAKMQKLLESK